MANAAADTDEKKRKRKLSNRESARRSRLKKQKLMEETIHEISSLERRIKENSERCRVARHRLDSVESENAFLRSQKAWLSSYVCHLENLIQSGGEDDDDHDAGDCRRRPDSLKPVASVL